MRKCGTNVFGALANIIVYILGVDRQADKIEFWSIFEMDFLLYVLHKITLDVLTIHFVEYVFVFCS